MTDLAIVVPTFNEKPNVGALVQQLEAALAGVAWEVVFVDDDSPDGTADAVRALAEGKARVRCLARIGRRGLSRAVVEGILSTSAPFGAVMDADLQHDETALAAMLRRLVDDGLDVVVASRYTAGGSVGTWEVERARMSRLATQLAHTLV